MIKASILIPVYNAEKTIQDTLNSIFRQTFNDFEIILINDGSTDKSHDIILSNQDTRIKYYINEKNKGLIYTLNKGLDLCNGEYIIRMDSDDIMLPNRVEKQIKFMDKNPDIIASGSSVIRFSPNKKEKLYTPPITPEEIKSRIYLGSPIPHPTAIIRKKILSLYKIKYDTDYIHAEDYKLWYDLSQYGKLANIKEPLIKYRCSESQVSNVHGTKQTENSCRLKQIMVEKFLQKYDIKLSSMFLTKDIIQIANKLPKEQDTSTIIFLMIMSLKKYNIFSFFNLLFSGLYFRKGFRIKYILAILYKHIYPLRLNKFNLFYKAE